MTMGGVMNKNNSNKKRKDPRWTKFRHHIAFLFFRPIFRIYLKIRYHYTAKQYKLQKGPHLIVFNHPTAFDPFMVSISFRRPIYFMATDDIFSLKFASWWIKYLVAPISKSKSFQDMNAVKNMLRVANEGGTIALSPEGNRTYTGQLCHINPAIVKLIKHLKIPLVFYNIEGGYGVSPRFSPFVRKGKMIGRVLEVLSPEQIQEISTEELYSLLQKHLTADDVLLHREFHHKRRAEHMERILHICPICNSKQTIYTYKEYVHCYHCKLEVEYTPNLTLVSKNPAFPFQTVADWLKYEEEYIRSIQDFKGIFYQDDAILLKKVIKNKKKELLLEGSVTIDFQQIVLYNTSQEFKFLLEEIDSMAVLGQNKINFYVGDSIYQIKAHPKFNAIKYMHLYYHVKHIRKGVKDEFLGI